MSRVGVLGTGTWAMALSSVLLDNGNYVMMWGRDPLQINTLRETGINPKYHLDCVLKGNIDFTTEINDLSSLDFLVIAVSTQNIRGVLSKIESLSRKTIIINVSKGIEITTLKLVNDIVDDFFPANKFVVLSGPSHAEEVARKLPTTIVSTSVDEESRRLVQELFFTDYLRVYTNSDVIGVELIGALKNIIALASGISDGIGYGDNTKAALMTRGMAEIKRLGRAMGAVEATFDGLAGIGDLIVTCTSMHSRNRRCGILLGEGYKLGETKEKIGMVVEGVTTLKAANELSEIKNIDMPITKALYQFVYKGGNPKELVHSLMNRSPKSEEHIAEVNNG